MGGKSKLSPSACGGLWAVRQGCLDVACEIGGSRKRLMSRRISHLGG